MSTAGPPYGFERTSVEAFDGKLPRCELRELDPPVVDLTRWPWRLRLGFYNQTTPCAPAAAELLDAWATELAAATLPPSTKPGAEGS